MNQIYSLVLNPSTGACQAVSEVASRGRPAASGTAPASPPRKTRLASACLLALASLACTGAWAQDSTGATTGAPGANGSPGVPAGTDGAAGSTGLQATANGFHWGVLTGGVGGTGGTGPLAGGAGGSGGAGLGTAAPGVVLYNSGSITGGQGGDSGIGAVQGAGGAGGTGVQLDAPATLLNQGGIEGGRGGLGRPSGVGGIGVTASGGASFENGGTVRGGLSGDGLCRADAIRFTGDNNWLGLLSTSVIDGNVVASTLNGDTLGLSGTTNATFDTTLIGPSGQYRNFAGFQKIASSTWTLTGATTARTPWQVLAGTLVISSDASLGSADGRLTLDGGTLRTTATTTASRPILLGVNNGTLQTDTGTTYTANGVISGSGGFTKTGDGTVVFGVDNTYTGGTTVAAGTLQLGNGAAAGTLAGNIANNAVLAFNRSDAALLAGAISGTGSVQQRGTGTTTLAGVNTYAGGTMVVAGTLAGNAASLGSGAIVNNAALVIDQASDGTLSNLLSGPGRLTKTGAGTLTLGGNSAAYSGGTQVAAGTLAVNGALGGLVTVGSGARLAGTGTVGNAVVQSGGTVLPGGAGIGTLNVAGDLTLAAGSTYQLNAASDGRSDQLRASGRATLQGGTVAVLASGTFQPTTSYAILSANGGVTGQFAGATTDMAFLEPFLTYSPQTVTLRLQRNNVSFQAMAQTPNQRAAAGAVTALGTGLLYSAVLPLSAANARSTFDSLSGEVHASLKSAAFEDSRFVRDAGLGRLRAALDTSAATGEGGMAAQIPAPERGGAWVQAFNSWGSTDGDGNASSVDRSTRGIFLGADTRVGDGWQLGVLGGYSHGRVTPDDRSSWAKSDTYHVGVYGGKQWGQLGLRAGATYSAGKAETRRDIAFPGFSGSTAASYNIKTTQAFGELGWKLPTANGSLEPFAGLAHVKLSTDGFTETGGPAALASGSSSTHVTYSTIGVRGSTLAGMAGGQTQLRGMLGWRHAFGGVNTGATLSLAGQPGFGVAGMPIAKNAVVIEGGIDFALGRNLTLGVGYVGQVASQLSDHGMKASLLWKF